MVLVYGICHLVLFIPLKLHVITVCVKYGSYHVTHIQVFCIAQQVFRAFETYFIEDFINKAITAPNKIVSSIFRYSCFESYTFVGYNYLFGDIHLKTYTERDVSCGASLQHIKSKKYLSSYDTSILDSLLLIATV